MDIRKIKKLIDLMDEKNIAEIEVKQGEESLRVTRHSHSTSVAAPMSLHQPGVQHAPAHPVQPTSLPRIEEEPKTNQTIALGHCIRSPMVGTMYLAPAPESPPFVALGQTVKVGDVVCIVEAMKMFNEIECDRAGKIVDILVKSGEPVEYDQPLFIIE